MMTPFSLARLHYEAADFEIIQPGSHVMCAVTGKPIALEDLLYWSAEFQEAYVDAYAATRAKMAGGARHLAHSDQA